MFFKRSSVPAAPPARDSLPACPEPAAPDAASPSTDATDAPRAVILVVDDSSVIRTAVANTLAAEHYEILQADDGVNGLAAWEKDRDRIALVISDVFMPRMDGLAMSRELRKRSRTLPVVLMSSKLDEDSRWIAEEAGFRLLPKPFKDALLLELVARMLRLHKAN
jgi:two-component system cell cycle sensor histidine kinase/response regulator CckA